MWSEDLEELLNKTGGSHTAWGKEHCKRIFELTLLLGEDQEIDKDALYAAAILHDFGAYHNYYIEGVDHVDRSVEVAQEILNQINFPKEKIDLVKKIIASHMFYNQVENLLEAKLFHDADVLDFLGYIGITRLLSIVGKEKFTPDLKTTLSIIRKFKTDLPNTLLFPKSKQVAEVRVNEMELFLNGLNNATFRMKHV